MSRIDALLDQGTTTSLEFFPPATEAGERRLWDTIEQLDSLRPSFASVTYGAGGGTRDRTYRIVTELLERGGTPPMAHLTAVNHSRAELVDILGGYLDAGVSNVLCLRGDPPQDATQARWELAHAEDLVALAREVGGDHFAIGVAAHPEGHPLSEDPRRDRDHLAAKLQLADFGVTQFFFRAADYRRMVDELAARGCTTPVIPGIMPVTNVRQIVRFAELSGAEVPCELAERLYAVEDDPDEVRRIGVEVATQLCQELLEDGAPGLHFYTLNRPEATREIHANLQLSSPSR